MVDLFKGNDKKTVHMGLVDAWRYLHTFCTLILSRETELK